MSSRFGSPSEQQASLWSSSDRWSLDFLTNNRLYWHRPRQTLQSGSRCPHLFKYQSSVIISTKIWLRLCVRDVSTLRHLTIESWPCGSFSRHILLRGHTEAHSSQCESMRTRSPVIRARRGIFVITPAQPTQPSPTQSSPGSLETVQSHTKTRHKTADILQILPSFWTRRCRGEETCRQSFLSRHLKCQASTPMSPSIGPHGTDVFTHKR